VTLEYWRKIWPQIPVTPPAAAEGPGGGVGGVGVPWTLQRRRQGAPLLTPPSGGVKAPGICCALVDVSPYYNSFWYLLSSLTRDADSVQPSITDRYNPSMVERSQSLLNPQSTFSFTTFFLVFVPLLNRLIRLYNVSWNRCISTLLLGRCSCFGPWTGWVSKVLWKTIFGRFVRMFPSRLVDG